MSARVYESPDYDQALLKFKHFSTFKRSATRVETYKGDIMVYIFCFSPYTTFV